MDADPIAALTSAPGAEAADM